MNLWLVRHAQPLIAPGICYGQLNIPADAEATRLCAQKLAEVLPPQLHIVSSPLQRCEQLMAVIIGQQPDMACKSTIRTDSRLQEMDFGAWEGRAWADIARTELDAWTADFTHYKVGLRGESVSAFMARVASIFDELPQDADTLWITHAGVIRAASLIAGGVRQISQADEWPVAAPACGQWCKLVL